MNINVFFKSNSLTKLKSVQILYKKCKTFLEYAGMSSQCDKTFFGK